MKLYDSGIYLVNGHDIVEEGSMNQPVSREEAAGNTMAYRILEAHNTSGNMEKLQIKFDKLTSHDITFVGIIQTARASGLEKFPVPYVPVRRNMAEFMYLLIRLLSTSLHAKCWQGAAR